MEQPNFNEISDRRYKAYESSVAAGRIANTISSQYFSLQESAVHTAAGLGLVPSGLYRNVRRAFAAREVMSDRMYQEFGKPEFGIDSVSVDGREIAVTEEVVEGQDKPFGSLLHFKRDTDREDPPLLLAAPMSGHYATLLRGTVRELLPHHDVYITDWKNARDVPLSEGEFGLEDYIGYMEGFIEQLGPDTNVVAVCQSTVPALAAVAHIARTRPDLQPATMTLMGGPLDTRVAPTKVTDLAEKHSIDWFAGKMLARVPNTHPGAGRVVYPGHMQLLSFMAMNPDKHRDALRKLQGHLLKDNQAEAAKITTFYDEYRAVCDLNGQFYIDTVAEVFQKHSLARGQMEYRGNVIDPSLITRTNVLTVEGSKDDISAPGQTLAAQSWLTGLRPNQQFHYLQDGAGHYGIFNGKHWSSSIAPRIAGFIRQTAKSNGRDYDAINEPGRSKRTENWRPDEG